MKLVCLVLCRATQYTYCGYSSVASNNIMQQATNAFYLLRHRFYLRNFCKGGADNFTFPGRFLARFSSFTLRIRSFSPAVVVRSFRNMFTAVFAAFPLLPVPRVNFTLNLQNNVLSIYVFESLIQKHIEYQKIMFSV